MKRLTLHLVIIIIFSSCASTEHVFLTVVEPAPVSLPSHVKKVVVLNRSQIAPQNRAIEVADKIFSLESAQLDRAGAESSINGVSDALSKNNRFDEIIAVTNSRLTSAAPGVFPSALSWKEVEAICREYHADAVFALELFDTDSKISYAANPVTINTPLGKIPGIEHTATMLTTVRSGWRIYDVAGKNILDEYPMEKRLSFYGKGINPAAAAAALLGRKEAVKDAGNKAGEQYAFRILPYSLRVKRDYYVKATDNFKIARRKAQTGNWDGAASIWQQETNHPEAKVAARACYNMAIICEINGKLEEAIGWAQRSYEQYGNRLALNYVKILERRRVSDAVLNEQTVKK